MRIIQIKHTKSLLFVSIFMMLGHIIVAQPSNPDCSQAIPITDPIDFCSSSDEFTNVDAGDSGYGPASCWAGAENDVWFQFTSFAIAANIVVSGAAGGGTLQNPQVALYIDNCGGTISELECASDVGGNDVISIFQSGLIIGQSYLIRVAGRGDQVGSFQLCINNFNPPVEPGQDCDTKAVICDKSPFVVQSVTGAGAIPDEAEGTCLGTGGILSEQQSTWFSWTAATSGSLTFTLTPLNASDDIDFVLYELPNGIGDCTGKIPIRCMATACSGPTGLNLESTDLEEDLNCDPGEDGFIQFIDMVAGNSYALMVNNFSNTGIGFGIEFGGTGEFQGPIPDFQIDPDSGLKCDEEFIATDFSSFPNGIITNWEWNFGERAVPQTANTEGPHAISYESFGTKFVALTIETDLGCVVTEVAEIEVEPCCEDFPDIGINVLDIQDLLCAGVPTGFVAVEGFGGFAEYQFAIDGGEFTDEAEFSDLDAGPHEISIADIKGCMETITVNIGEPDPIIVEAGPDQTVDLGFPVDLLGSYTPVNNNDIIEWSPPDGLSCIDCLDPSAIAGGTTTYYLTVIDDMGCIGIDSLTVFTNDVKPIYAPNVFTPNRDGINDFFNLFAGPAASEILSLKVYDRWGNKVYDSSIVELGNIDDGWDGTFLGEEVGVGVYTWIADVLFIDSQNKLLTGDVTLLR